MLANHYESTVGVHCSEKEIEFLSENQLLIKLELRSGYKRETLAATLIQSWVRKILATI